MRNEVVLSIQNRSKFRPLDYLFVCVALESTYLYRVLICLESSPAKKTRGKAI